MAAGLAGRTTAALALTVAVLSGCSEEQPANDSLPSASAETTSSEALPPLGPADFPVPDEARQKTPEGALEFTRYYLGLGARIADGSVEPQVLLDLSENCALCHQVAASYQEDRAAGFTYEGFSFTFHEYGPPRLDGDVAEIGFVYSQSSYLVVDEGGEPVPDGTVTATGDLQSGAHLEWREDRVSWVVTSLTIG